MTNLNELEKPIEKWRNLISSYNNLKLYSENIKNNLYLKKVLIINKRLSFSLYNVQMNNNNFKKLMKKT